MNNLEINPLLLNSTLDAFGAFLATRRLSSEEISIYRQAVYGFVSEALLDASVTLEESADLAGFTNQATRFSLRPNQAEEAWRLWQQFIKLQVSGASGTISGLGTENVTSSRTLISRDELISRYALAMKSDKRSPSTIKNYLADLRAFFDTFGSDDSIDFLTKPNVTNYLQSLEGELSPSTIERKTTTLRQFFTWTKLKGYTYDNPLELPPITQAGNDLENSSRKCRLPAWILSYLSFRLTPYLHLALMMVFVSLVTFGAYKQFVLNVSLTQAFPTTLTRPNRILSFQARLTNPSGNPITGSTPMSFRLYDASGGGTNLWSGSCSVSPDANGIFSTLLGSTCGAEIDSSVFSENAEVWLEVQVDAEVLSPRQRIATVAYALNSETLQGYPPASPAQINTIPVVNNAGAIIIGAASPTLQSTTGTFAVQGEALVISTNTGSGGDITIAPDGTGQVNIIGGTTTDDTLTIRNANLSSGNLVTGIVSNNNTGYKFLSFQGGSSPAEKFSVNAVGNVVAVGTYTGRGAILTATAGSDVPLQVNGTGGNVLSVANSGDITHAIGANIKPNTDSTTALNIANASGTRYVTFDSSNQRVGIGTTAPGTALDVSGSVTVSSLNTPGGIIYDTNSSGTLGVSAAGTAGQCLVSGGTGAPTWTSCGSGSGGTLWRISDGAISPVNDTLDLLIGSTATGSAQFGFLNVNSGTPTFQIDGNSVLTSTTLGSTVVNSSLTSVGALSSGSITTGFGTISTTNTITGTTINGTTGINTGAGAGTQRIDASGNLVNINDITAGGTVTISSLPTAGAVLYTASGGVVSQTAVGTSGQCLISGGAGSPTWTACAVAANNYWQLNGTVLSPGNSTWDLAVGGNATSSALFQVFGATGNATTSGNITFAGSALTNVIAARNMAGITIGDAQTGNITVFGLGTGVVHSTDGVLSSSAVNLTSEVTGVLPIANGGTNASTIGGAGSITYSTGTAYAFSAVGTLGQCLVSGGAGTPTWTSCSSAAQNYWQNDGTTVAPSNTTWNLAIGGESTSSAKFLIDGGNGNATTSGNFVFGGTSVTNLIAARNMAGLTLGDSQTGNINFNNNGSVGIHNANPTATFDVTGTAAISSTLTLSSYTSCNGLTTTSGGVVTCNTNPFANVNFWQLNDEVLSPGISTRDLAIGGNSTATAKFQVFADTGLASTSGGLTFNNSSANYINVLNDKNLTVRNSPGGDAGLVDRLTILANGNVGIGDASPNSLFTVGSGDLFQVNSAGAITASTGVATTGDISITSINPRIFYFDSSAGDDDFLTFVDADTYAVQNNTTGDTYLSLSPSTLALGNNTVTKNIRIGGVTTSATDTVGIATNGTLADSITIGNTNVATNLSFFSKNVSLTTDGLLSLGSNTTLAPLYVTNGYGANAAFILNQLNSGDILSASASGVTRMTLSNAGLLTLSAYNTAGAVVYTDVNGTLNITAQGSTGQCLVSGGSGSPTWTACSGATNYWQLDPTSTVLSPGNSTWDLAVGGTATASSKFQIAGLTGDATTSGNLTFYGGTAATNLIAARADAGLFIGDSQTGNVIINPDGNIGIKNLTPLATLDVTGTASISSTLTMGGAIQPAIGPLTLNYKSGPNAWAAALTIQSTTGNVGIGTTNPQALLHVVGTLTQSGGNVSINDSGSTTTSIGSGTNTGAITIGDGATTQSVSLGTGAGAKTIDIGSSNTTSITRIVSGSGGVLINDSINQPVGIGTTTSTGTITIGGAAAQTLDIGNGAAAKTVNLGSSNTTSTTTLLSGSGGLNLNVDNNQPTNINSGTSTGTVTIGGGSATIKLNLGSDATGDVFYRNSSGNVARLGIGSTGQVLVVSSGLPSWGGGVGPTDGTVGWWQRNLGVLAPANITDDLAVGGIATATAKFQVFGNSGNATTSGNLTFAGTAATNVIAARNMAGITIGDAQTGNITVFGLVTGVVHSTDGVLSSSDVDLTTEVTGVLPIANGGTNASTIGGAGSIAYSTGTAYAFSAAGTSGQCLVSGGTGSPTWSTCGGANYWQLNDEVISPGISSRDLAIGGISTASAKFQAFGIELDSGNVAKLNSTVITTGDVLSATASAITTGNILKLAEGGNQTFSGNVIFADIDNTGGGGGAFTGNFLRFDNATTTRFTVSNTGAITSAPLNTPGGVVYAQTGGLMAVTAAGTTNQCLVSGGSGTPTWANCTVVSNNYWQVSADNVLSPGNNTWGFALGGNATASAKFFVDQITGNTSIGTGTPTAPLLISSGYGSNATLIVNQLNSGDLIAASASGTTRFRIDNSGNVIAASFQDIANTAYYLDPANAVISLTLAGKAGIGTTDPTFMLETTGVVTGKALSVFNETGNQSILVASSSGTRVFEISHDGDLTIGNVAKADVPVNLYGDVFQQSNTSLTSGTGANDVFIYDVTKDSDGGAWTDSNLSQQLSWYTEAKDDGPADTCSISTDDRCGQSAFPKKSTLVVNNGTLYIYDALNNKLWMKFTQDGTYALGADTNNNPASVFALNGVVYVGLNGASSIGLVEIDFKNDLTARYNATDRSQGDKNIANRNSAVSYATNSNTNLAILSAVVNDVHANVTLGKTYLAAATGAGVSLIHKSDNRVTNYGLVGPSAYTATWMTDRGDLYGLNQTLAKVERWAKANTDGNWRGIGNEVLDIAQTDRSWGSLSGIALAASASNISSNAPDALYVAQGQSEVDGSSDAIYVGTDDGLTAIHDAPAFPAPNMTSFSTTGQVQLPVASLNSGGAAHAQIGTAQYAYIVSGGSPTLSTVYKATIDSSGNMGAFATTSQAQLPAVVHGIPGVVTANIGGTHYLYVIGGLNVSNQSISSVYKSTLDSSGNAGTFATTSQGQLQIRAQYTTATIVNINGTNYAYTVGGYDNLGSGLLSTVQKATIDSSGNVGTWSTTGQGQLPAGRALSSLTASRIDGTYYLYLSGGYNGGATYFSEIYRAAVDGAGNVGPWLTINGLPTTLGFHMTHILNDGGTSYMYVAGGFTGVGALSTVYRNQLDAAGFTTTFTTTGQGQLAAAAYAGQSIAVNTSGQLNFFYFGGTGGSQVYKGTLKTTQGAAKYYNTSYITENMIGDIRGMWPFVESSGSLQDRSVKGNFLEDEDPPTYGVSGVRGTALTFNGTSDHLCSDADNNGTCDTDTDYDFGAESFSVSTWFKHSTTISGTDMIIDRFYNTTPTVQAGWRAFMSSSGNIVWQIDDDASLTPDDEVTSNKTYNDNQWHHLVLVKDSTSKIMMFVDGIKVSEDNGLIATGSLSGSSNIMGVGAGCGTGAACSTGDSFWDGSLDELTITAEALTANQVLHLYESGRSALKKRTISVTDATTATSTTIGDSGETWTPNEFVGTIVEIFGGTGAGQTRTVVSNTATVLTVSPAFTTTPDTTSDFEIKPQQLYGGTDTVTAVYETDDPVTKQRFLYVGSNSGTGTGGVSQFDLGADSLVDAYHNDAGKTDENGNAWSTTSSNDDINAIGTASRVLAIGSTNLYWQKREGLQVTAELDRLRNDILTLQQQSQGAPIAASNISGVAEKYQVIRKGWGWGATSGVYVPYGIRYDDVPVVMLVNAGTVASQPPSLTQCNSALNVVIHAYAIQPQQFVIFSNSGNYCFTWMSIGSASTIMGPELSAGFSAGADLAEWYSTDDTSLKAGEVVSVAKSGDIKVERTDKNNKQAAIGIVTTRPATILGDQSGLTPGYKEDEFKPGASSVAIALSGRVPVKVSLENGIIKPGDFLAPASIPGYVSKAITAGPVVGKAMETFDGKTTITNIVTPEATESALLAAPDKDSSAMKELDHGRGIIMAFVQNGYWDPDAGFSAGELATNFSIQTNTASESALLALLPFQLRGPLGQVIDKVVTAGSAMIANLEAGFIRTRDLVAERFSIGGNSFTASTSANGEDLMIKLGSENASRSGTNTLTIADRYSNPVATIDEHGNASFSGTLTAKNGLFDGLTLNDASISGTLYAQNISGLREKIENLVEGKLASASSLFAYDRYPSTNSSASSELVASITGTNSEVLSRIAALESRTQLASGSGLLANSQIGDISISGIGDFGSLIARSALTISSTILIDSTGISSAADELAIQGSGHGTIKFLAGAMTLDSTGLMVNTDAFFARSVTIKEDLMVNVIRSLNGDVSIHLATPSSELSDRLAIMNNQTQEVASIDASGSARFNKLIIASDRQDPGANASVLGQYTTNASTGESVLPAGTQSLKIISPKVSLDSLVYVTPTSSTSNQVLYVSSKHVADPNIPGDYSYFYVSLDNTLAVPVTFNWWIIN